MIFQARHQLLVFLDRARAPIVFVVEQLDTQIGFEQGGELAAELQFCRMDLTIGVNELVDRAHQLLLIGRVEALEDLETAQLELGVNEGILRLALGHGLGNRSLTCRLMPSKTSLK